MAFLGELELLARIPHRILLKTAKQRLLQAVEVRHVGFRELAVVTITFQ